MAVLKQAEAGVKVPDVCREHGISSATFYKWRSCQRRREVAARGCGAFVGQFSRGNAEALMILDGALAAQ